jgi:glycosyl-4,4'-diaponeurosporenoate acyltransferase
MRFIHLSTFWTVLLDIFAWFVIHVVIVMVMVWIPRDWFNPSGNLYRVRSWERSGRFYVKAFRIRRWKDLLPDGAKWMKERGFPKKRLAGKEPAYLAAFSAETCRAELTHWTTMLMAPFFFLWNKPAVGWIMILYALLENLPLIMAQRYNRSRLEKLLRKYEMRGHEKCRQP